MNDARNTFNSIAGRPQLMTSVWCKIGLHRWQKWSELKKVSKPGYNFLHETAQERYCDSCNRYQRRVLSKL